MRVPKIETERLVLRPFVASDAEDVFAYASAPEFSKYVEYASPTTLAEVQDFLEHVLMPEDPNQLSWAVCDRDQSKVLGTLQITHDMNCATVHYDISHTVYGRGYTTEALRAVLQWCLVHLPEITQFLGDTLASNVGSRRVMEKCGFTSYKTEKVRWEKFNELIELVFYRAERRDLENSPQNITILK